MEDMNTVPGAEDANTEAEVTAAEATAANAEAMDDEEDDWDDVDSFIDGASGDFTLPDASQAVILRTSSGGDKYVPVSQPTSLRDVIEQSGLFIGGAVQYWMNGAQIKLDDVVPGGSTITVIGSVKGG